MSCKVFPCVLSFHIHFQQAKCCQYSLAKVFPLPLKYAHTDTRMEWKLKKASWKVLWKHWFLLFFCYSKDPRHFYNISGLKSPVYTRILKSFYAGSSGFSTILSLPHISGHRASSLNTGKRACNQSRRGCHLFLPDLLEDTKSVQLCTKTCVHVFLPCFFSSFLQYKVNHRGGIASAPSRWTMNVSEDVKPICSSPTTWEKLESCSLWHLVFTFACEKREYFFHAAESPAGYKVGVLWTLRLWKALNLPPSPLVAVTCREARVRGIQLTKAADCIHDFCSATDPRRDWSTCYYF